MLEEKFNSREIAEAFAYIEGKWPELTFNQPIDDGTLIGLPHPFVVPSVANESGFSFQEMYYWDSYFIVQGLMTGGHDELSAGMLENMIVMARRFHIIPNASRMYFSGRSQPPFLTSFIFDIFEAQDKDLNWLTERISVAEREYNSVWMHSSHPNWRNVFQGLSRYYDINLLDHLAEAESGWDMNTRFSGKALSFIPIDLQALLYKYETDFARASDLIGQPDNATIWRERAQKRAATVTEYLWDEDAGFFFDLDYITFQKSKVWSLAAYYTMWSGMATPEQARRMTENLDKFTHQGGLTTSSSPDEYFGETPTQWAYPNGWAPLHWLTCLGLRNYGHQTEAESVARAWIGNNLQHFQVNGVFREAYNVVNPELPPKPGVYPPQLGFGWTNGVFVDLAKKFLTPDELEMV
jgi:alpha,alpha-trehalase